MKKSLLIFLVVVPFVTLSTGSQFETRHRSPVPKVFDNGVKNQFFATSSLLDASINSLNSLNSLIKKENYRNKITAFNNPTTTDMGFSLEVEIQTALKPILEKTKSTNTDKFSNVVASLVNNPAKSQLGKTTFGTTGIFGALISLVGTLAISEKKVTRQDLDSFMLTMSKYFVQYEKLNQANQSFDQNIEKFTQKLQELQFDIREFMLDMITVIHPRYTRAQLKSGSMEELFLKYLDKDVLGPGLFSDTVQMKYPGDGIKTAKEIVYGIQKLFREYQKIYGENYTEIKTILLQSKELGKNINTRQVDASLLELQHLYNDSKDADVLNLRLHTLTERLKILVATEQMK